MRSHRPPPRVLVADDEVEHAAIVAALLRRRGFDVLVVHSAGDVVDRVAAERPALVLLDVFMPAVDGISVASALRSDPRTRRVPIVLLSASAGDERVRALQGELGVTLLSKPFHVAELLWAVEVALAEIAIEAQP
jgi:CheY-like chemotaxis protein